MPFASRSPTHGQVLRSFEAHTAQEVEARLQQSQAAFLSLGQSTFTQRAGWLNKVAELLDAERSVLARLITEEMGKPLAQSEGELSKCAATCRFYASHAEAFLKESPLPHAPPGSFVRYEPLGTVLAVMPWNFPFWQVVRFAAPALMAGNTGLLKHAHNVPQCALALESLFLRAGFPKGAFQTLLIDSASVGALIEDPRVHAVTLTGSERAGQAVGAQAGKALKKAVLELGGSDPFIVMPSADLDRAVETAVRARLVNNGQSCVAAKRFLIAESVAPVFEQRFVERMRKLKVGDPLETGTELGPLATESIREELEQQVKQSVSAGTRLLLGGERIAGKGFFFAPTVLADPPREAPAYGEELFGPVATLFRFKEVEGALALANDTRFGLGASVWTRDPGEQRRFIEGLRCGMVFVNEMVASDPALPFGGIKHSGFGRELSIHGIHEFVNVKTVRLAS